MKKQIEILAPAGSYECLKAAVISGADAVYLGGAKFGARAFANNFDEKELLEAIDYVHLHGRKIYLTLNTLLKNQELYQELYEYLRPYYKQGLDAVIVQDMGVLSFVKKYFPSLPVHASTQMTITQEADARLIEAQGVERVVPARELGLEEIRKIKQHTSLDVECFVHGALCYCYSGQCLLSSLLGGRSGNRGQCAQPCRLPYKVEDSKQEKYWLSLKDICTLDGIPDMIDAGIDSFKIEGRMKKPEYVSLVTGLYRKYADLYLQNGRDGYRIDEKDKEKLLDIYNRGGFHGGYYQTHNGKEMLSIDRPNHAGVRAAAIEAVEGRKLKLRSLTALHKGDIIELPHGKDFHTLGESIGENQLFSILVPKHLQVKKGQLLYRTRNEKLISEVSTQLQDIKIQEKMNGEFMLSTEESAKLKLQYRDISVTVEGEKAQEAVNRPMDEERIEKQLRKTGGTPFYFEKIKISLNAPLFYPLQSLNELRRRGIEKLIQAILEPYRRGDAGSYQKEIKIPKNDAAAGESPHIHVSVEKIEQFEEVLLWGPVRRIYIDANITRESYKGAGLRAYVQKGHANGKEIYYSMPHIFRERTKKKYEANYQNLLACGFDGFLVRSLGELQFLKDMGYDGAIVSDYNLYQWNEYSKQFFAEQGIAMGTAPLELNANELRELTISDSELLIYGYIPVMVTAQCIKKSASGCDKSYARDTIKDRQQKKMVVKSCCDYCYNLIYNTVPLVLFDCKEEIQSLHPKAVRISFTSENQSMTAQILNKSIAHAELGDAFTRGHFKRGVK